MAAVSEYVPRGKIERIGSFDAYVTGDITSSKAIIGVSDAFGLLPVVQRGADLLAASTNFLVVFPDYFDGSPALLHWLTPEGRPDEAFKAEYQVFVAEKAHAPGNLDKVLDSVTEAKKAFPHVTAWGGLGLGWGGKLIARASGANTPFKASGQAYPSQPSNDEASQLTIPHIMLASPTDNAEGVAAYAERLHSSGTGEVETYKDMYHGWMGARALMDQPDTVREYERGYKQIAKFFVARL